MYRIGIIVQSFIEKDTLSLNITYAFFRSTIEKQYSLQIKIAALEPKITCTEKIVSYIDNKDTSAYIFAILCTSALVNLQWSPSPVSRLFGRSKLNCHHLHTNEQNKNNSSSVSSRERKINYKQETKLSTSSKYLKWQSNMHPFLFSRFCHALSIHIYKDLNSVDTLLFYSRQNQL